VDPQAAWDAVQSWPAADRIAFATRLWDDALADGGAEPSDDFDAELDRRLDAHDADLGNVLTQEQVRERFRGRM
jgi:putative addiction module component (TIGR02574 family)